ncbi:hypothetical protein BKA67DRAFT_571256 [Truncatella angustata]|uniref:Uncharacterized protein n=1 Tax=Truncatella angustata TaxID=152316 RepID=A0A9P8UG82_9PEZI|nr:uncharacterized protein BKA67DRAFT_571256 [Truncatella angustata]KAH6651575.1 hypothetical protein BKA67DRAFT_571256 [Truncatella angustata]
MQSRPSKVRKSFGRPRLDGPGAATLSEDRRQQIRRAQRTYRRRREETLQSSISRSLEWEEHVQIITRSLLEFYDAAYTSKLHETHPALFAHLTKLRKILQSGCDPSRHQGGSVGTVATAKGIRAASTEISTGWEAKSKKPMAITALGYQITEPASRSVLNSAENRSPNLGILPKSQGFQSLVSTKLAMGRNVASTIQPSYSFQETSFTRRLHRYSLEYAFRLFCDPRSDPGTVYRTFRLVPCVQDKAKMYPYFKKLVSSERDEPLEIAALPFYCIGGAGRHYPLSDEHGNPKYPLNSRLPRRLIGLPNISLYGSEAELESNRHRMLETLCLEGDWLDCRDVEGYLRSKGAITHKSYEQPDKHMEIHGSATTYSTHNRVDYAVDIDLFLEGLIPGFALLGRAPGFRRCIVEDAYHRSLQNHVYPLP